MARGRHQWPEGRSHRPRDAFPGRRGAVISQRDSALRYGVPLLAKAAPSLHGQGAPFLDRGCRSWLEKGSITGQRAPFLPRGAPFLVRGAPFFAKGHLSWVGVSFIPRGVPFLARGVPCLVRWTLFLDTV